MSGDELSVLGMIQQDVHDICRSQGEARTDVNDINVSVAEIKRDLVHLTSTQEQQSTDLKEHITNEDIHSDNQFGWLKSNKKPVAAISVGVPPLIYVIFRIIDYIMNYGVA